MSLGERFLAALEARPRRTLLEGDGGRHAAGALAERARVLAGGLARAGVRPGDRVAVCLPRDAWLVAGHVGALAAGAVVVPLNPAHPDAALADQIRRVEPALALTGPELAERALRLAPGLRWAWAGAPEAAPTRVPPLPEAAPADPVPRDAADPALLVFTSGTTGRPKGVPLSHGNLESNLDALRRVWAWEAADRLLHVLPAFHLHGLGVALYGTLLAGGSLVLHARFEAERVLGEAGPSGATLLMAVPTMLHRLVEAAGPAPDPRLAGLRAVISGSAPLAPALFERFRERFGIAPVERYGMSETMMNASQSAVGERVPGSVGPPVPGVSLRLVEATGADAGAGPGEVEVRGPNVFAGYWRDVEATRAAFRPAADGGAPWFRTGDLGRLDERGRLFLVGRLKEIIVTGGYNVSPLAVEQALEADAPEALAELAVAGVPDPDLGERVVAFVVARGAAERGAGFARLEASLRERAAERLPAYARPREYRAVAALPRTALGKVERARLAGASGRQPTGESA